MAVNEMKNNETVTKVVNGTRFAVKIPALITYFLVALIGLIMFLVAITYCIQDLNYIKTTAVVVDVKYDEDINKYHAVYEFDFDGRKVQVEGNSHYEEDEIKIGSERVITYDPTNYERIDDGAGGIMMLIFSIIVLMITIPAIILFIKNLIGYFKSFKKA